MPLTSRLTRLIDCFYVMPLRALMSKQTFRYLACGGLNWIVSTAFYYTAFNFMFMKRNLDLGITVVSPHIAALGLSLPVSFLIGFWLQKNISFKSSPLRGRTQLFRYFLSSLAALVLTYLLDKLLVEVCHVFPTVAFMMIYLITAALNFFAQKHFTFRGAEKE